MKATEAYAAKRALFDKLAVESQPGWPLEGVQVGYQSPREESIVDLFGGGLRWEQTETSGEEGRILVDEHAHLTVIVRCSDPNRTVRDADAEVERIVDVVSDLFDKDPYLDDHQVMQVVAFPAGQGDYQPSSEGWGRSFLAFEVTVQCLIR